MKKFNLVLAAVTMAITFSAFTPKKASQETVYYFLNSEWHEYENPCPSGALEFCTIDIGQQTDIQLYRDRDPEQPVKYTP